MRPARALPVTIALLAVAVGATGCTARHSPPEPTPSSGESIAVALARQQQPQDVPTGVPLGTIDRQTVRRVATIPPFAWYVGTSVDGANVCALGVRQYPDGATSAEDCRTAEQFRTGGLKTFMGVESGQSYVWLLPDAAATVDSGAADGWTVLGPSVLVPRDGPSASPR